MPAVFNGPTSQTRRRRVFAQALHDAKKGCPKARRWLLEDSPGLRFWCESFGIDPEKARLGLNHALENEFADRGSRDLVIATALRREPGASNSELSRRFGCHREVIRKVRLKLESKDTRLFHKTMAS